MTDSKLKKRTPAQWQKLIIDKVCPEAWTKIACTVWWDYLAPQSVSNDWFNDMKESYFPVHEVEKEMLSISLKAIGYPKSRITRITETKWWDVVKNRQKNAEQSKVAGEKWRENENAKAEC